MIISALFVPDDNCSNPGLGRIHKLSENNLSVTFTSIVILLSSIVIPFVLNQINMYCHLELNN